MRALLAESTLPNHSVGDLQRALLGLRACGHCYGSAVKTVRTRARKPAMASQWQNQQRTVTAVQPNPSFNPDPLRQAL